MKLNNRGYTILESLLAIVVISVLALPLFKLLSTEKRSTVTAREKTVAYFLASAEMEKLKTQSIPSEDLQDKEYNEASNGKNYTVKRTVKRRFEEFGSIVDENGQKLREVTVAVSLKDNKLSELTSLFGGLESAKDTVQQ